MARRDPRIDAYIRRAAPFARPILAHLRDVVHAACPEVEETLKWAHPTFMYKGMLCGMAAFKAHCTFGFWRHALLEGELPAREKNAMGQFGRLTSPDDLPADRVLARLVKSAAKINELGVKPPPRKKPDPNRTIATPPFLARALKQNRKAADAYGKFSYSHKKEYVEWLTAAKTDETRQRRLTQAIAWMADGKARNWKYM